MVSGRGYSETQLKIVLRLNGERVFGRKYKRSEIAEQAGITVPTMYEIVLDYAARKFQEEKQLRARCTECRKGLTN